MVFSVLQDVKKRQEEITKKHQYEIRVMQTWTEWLGKDMSRVVCVAALQWKSPLTLLMIVEVNRKELHRCLSPTAAVQLA